MLESTARMLPMLSCQFPDENKTTCTECADLPRDPPIYTRTPGILWRKSLIPTCKQIAGRQQSSVPIV